MSRQRDPGPNFSTRRYLQSVPDAPGAPLPPFLHAIAHGNLDRDRRLRQPDDTGSLEALVAWSGLFDEPWYLWRYPDVARSTIPPLHRFVAYGALELRDPGPGFDSEFRPHAAAIVAVALSKTGAAAAYSDHDRIGPDGPWMQPVFKPAMSPEFMCNLAYAGPVVALVRNEGAQA